MDHISGTSKVSSGANDEGNWRGILEYFSPAVQLGLTATPKRKGNVDTYAYFGEPVYIYSLRELGRQVCIYSMVSRS